MKLDKDNIPWRYLISSVTGQKVTDIVFGESLGNRVYLGNTIIHDNTWHGQFTAIGFKVTDPVSGSTQELKPSGEIPTPTGPYGNPHARIELAGLGTSVPTTQPPSFPEPDYGSGGFVGDAGFGCVVDGQLQSSCDDALWMVSKGWAMICPNNNCGPVTYTDPVSGHRSLTSPFFYRGNSGGYWVGMWTSVTVEGEEPGKPELVGTTFVNYFDDPDLFDRFHRMLRALTIWVNRVKVIKNGEGGDFEKDENSENVLRSFVWAMYDPDCEKAYKAAGLSPLADVINKKGLTIAGAGVLKNPKSLQMFGITNEQRERGLVSIDNHKSQAFTINRAENPVMFFKNNAFQAPTLFNGFASLNEVVVHEQVHVADVGDHTFRFFGISLTDDLGSYGPFPEILAACRFDK